jgi:Ran GTPase-activating protein (RanGAP) involved in mRNA processing and transport
VTDRDVEIIAKRAIINRQCTSLVLRENEITYQGASIIADTFRQNIHLKKLDLSYNKLSDKGVRFLAEALLSNITLTELNLGSTGITNRGIIYLKETLQFNDTLEKLYLYENDIDDDGMKLLTDVLSEYNQSLTLLSLYSNRLITDESIDSLMDLFRQNRSLKRIELHQCSFSKEVKTRLQDAAENVLISICI